MGKLIKKTLLSETTILKKTWDEVFKSGPSKICIRHSLKNLEGYGLLKQTISLQIS